MLKISNLHASVEDKDILKGINLEIKAGEVHAIMGPNGAGKSTLSSIIAGNENYEVTEGEILLEGEDISELAPEERAHKGIFLSFQYPVEIPGVSVTNFMKTAINESRKALNLEIEQDSFLSKTLCKFALIAPLLEKKNLVGVIVLFDKIIFLISVLNPVYEAIMLYVPSGILFILYSPLVFVAVL